MARKPTRPAKKAPAPKAKAKAPKAGGREPGPFELKLSPTKRAQLARIHALGLLNKKPKPAAKGAGKGVNLTGDGVSRPATKDL